MQLVIVESPTKAKTISRFLGKDFSVASSYGHVRDLPPKKLGVDLKNNFEPEYVILQKAKPNVKELKKQATQATEVILATDEDREGESIAFHLKEVLGLKDPKRIVFHEITEKAINAAMQHPRKIDMKLVNSQQARRILDRLVGYKLSPFLWKKVMRGLSAGRVQSVVVRLICEREKERDAFKEEEYWSIEAKLQQKLLNSKSETLNKSQIPNSKSQTETLAFSAFLAGKDGKALDKLAVKNQKQAEEILNDLEGATYQVEQIEKKQEKRNPQAPFKTSTLQQEASSKLRFSAKKTMMIAQGLYERGLITYHRTDSLNLSKESLTEAKELILNKYGQEYWAGTERIFKTKAKSAQEAHEAIRPVKAGLLPANFSKLTKITKKEFLSLYALIWQRFIASQMKEAAFDTVLAKIKANNYTFRATGQTLQFDGFLKVYPSKFSENALPELEEKEALDLKELKKEQHFTKPPARYSQATLIKELEKQEIGRPSTYAVIMDTIERRGYVEKDENKKLKPTKIGLITNDMLTKHFPQIVDIQFTAKMEKELDEVEDGTDTWQKTLKDFYFPFAENLAKKEEEVEKKDLTEKTDKKCPECKKDLIIRLGRFGKFLACSGFPECKYTAPLKKPGIGIKCPKCSQGEISEKFTKKRKLFYGCSNWPHCDFALWDKPIDKTCPSCGSLLTLKRDQEICPNKECSSFKGFNVKKNNPEPKKESSKP
ncbi:MAG: type I DNA topoisomerase [bacterium]|nr:type I DNA topoisomerase [bacterium]